MPDGCILGPFLLIADVSVDVDVDGCYIVSPGCLGYFDSYGVVCLHFVHGFSCFVFGNCCCSFSLVFIVNVNGDINVDSGYFGYLDHYGIVYPHSARAQLLCVVRYQVSRSVIAK